MGVTLPPTETGELAAMRDLLAATPPETVESLGIAVADVGEALAFRCAAAPVREFNRVLGATTPDELDGAEAFFRTRGGPFWVAPPPGAGLQHELERRGYARDYGWTKFTRAAGSPPAARTDLTVVEADADTARIFGETACVGYGLGPEFAPWLATLPGRAGWLCVLAYDGERPVGTGAAFVADGAAWLGLGATRAEARGRGSQTAILAHRIARAAELGCSVVVTETGEQTDERPSGSYRNILRAGFEEAYVRPNYASPPDA